MNLEMNLEMNPMNLACDEAMVIAAAMCGAMDGFIPGQPVRWG